VPRVPSRVEDGLPAGPRLPRVAQTWAAANRPLELLEYGRERFGKTFTIHALSQPPLVYFSDPADIQEIFSGSADSLHPGEGASLLLPILGEQSFLLLDEDDHLYSRKVVMPSLHSTAVQQHADFVTELTEREIATWPRDIPFALHPRLRALILETILRVVFGPTPDPRLPRLRDHLLSAFSIFSSVLLPAPLLRRVPPGRARWSRFQRRLHQADEIIYALIDERGEDFIRQGAAADLLRAAHDEDSAAMSRKAIRDNIVTMLLAGHETTASTLAWSFQALAHNPPALQRVVEEIDEGTGDAYLKATVYEVLRYRPVFIFTAPRVVKRRIEIGNRAFAPPTYLFGAIYLVHHDPTIYPEPGAFRPERFLDSAPETPLWIPWGGGRKRCPGLHLALMELEVVIRTVLRRLAIQPAGKKMERAKLRSLIVAPDGGCRLILHDRP
jgi:cytochrome P450